MNSPAFQEMVDAVIETDRRNLEFIGAMRRLLSPNTPEGGCYLFADNVQEVQEMLEVQEQELAKSIAKNEEWR